ncbi:hypothetical protein PFICI_12901 [Pestalotiopsis fici W106-1]|uniref:Deacetylase sirtuin-type domain-containing protein n=1 Tax=Pestalotiopsis fici (strain W106-1 / CGMCC3.15140) TaxID=1229662 RepID=W3WS23_PESFW|nr:uncharacterized protein PFICI_12901 [Pestalotiopsis fici W106-1]ETS75957.1 hypothetical protein PFICI_12901 [Pestalotiopsis fici W106-1]
MPTVQITPGSAELLQNVADTLGKSKRVVMITGAGISTNSGIPAQYDKAEASGDIEEDSESNGADINDRPTKRRRTSQGNEALLHGTPTSTRSASSSDASPIVAFPGLRLKKTESCNEDTPTQKLAAQPPAGIVEKDASNVQSEQRLTRSVRLENRLAMSRHSTGISSSSSTTHDSVFSAREMSRSSTQTDVSMDTVPAEEHRLARVVRTPRTNRLVGLFSSSPLSSPPPVLFDPYDQPEEPTDRSSNCSEPEDSDQDDGEEDEGDFLSSQTSQARLRTMKGRDLFDSNIWKDPLKISVFYRFATTLRQKVRDVEPTTTHHFIARLRDIGKLARVYTQNIDEIEKKIGLSTDLKIGAGNKRRKSAKQQRLVDNEAGGTDVCTQAKNDSDAAEKDLSQPSQNTESLEVVKNRMSTTSDKGVECVFLHGSLQALRCFACAQLCDWGSEDREALTMSGEQPECPHCAGATAARQEKGKRALGVGVLRPDIVLYGEEHPQSDLISSIVQHDLSVGPDLMLVLGTSLKVHGLKVMVREFAKAVHQKGGKVVFINFTKPSESIWGDIIDYWVQWDCDAWVDDLKQRKPTLWMSPDGIVAYEKLKREELAEKKREAASIKKREEQAEKEAAALKKREELAEKREAAALKKREELAEKREAAAVKKRQELAEKEAAAARKREELARKREAVAIKKRESMEEKNREAMITTPRASHQEESERPKPKETPVPVPIPFVFQQQTLAVAGQMPPVSSALAPAQPAQASITLPAPGLSTASISAQPSQAPPAFPSAIEHEKTVETESLFTVKQEEKVSPKSKGPAKNPQAERNDYNCGAYCMSTIAEAFYAIRGEKFDFFGYTPSPRPNLPISQSVVKPDAPGKPATKARKSRHSAPSALSTSQGSFPDHRAPAFKASLLSSPITKDKLNRAAAELGVLRPQTPLRVAELRGNLETAGYSTQYTLSEFQLQLPGNPPDFSANCTPAPLPTRQEDVLSASPDILSFSARTEPVYSPSASVSAAVKTNPRKRKPTAKAMSSMPTTPKQVPPARSGYTIPQPAVIDQENILPPFRREQQAGPRLATMEPSCNPSPPHSPLDQTPLASLSPNQRRFSLQHLHHPMMLSSPLVKLPIEVRKESTPSPSDQLREEAAIALSGMRMCR